VSDINSLIETWREILEAGITRWVIFKHGTIVICRNPDVDIKEYAIELMRTMGVVIPGSSHGDFNVTRLEEVPGWVVHYHHEDILSYVSPEELDEQNSPDMLIGLIGRKKRANDAQELEIVHIELPST